MDLRPPWEKRGWGGRQGKTSKFEKKSELKRKTRPRPTKKLTQKLTGTTGP